jgi:hypothetical protein
VCIKYAHKMTKNYKRVLEAESKFKETIKAIKAVTLSAVVKPHTLDQSNKELTNFSRS